MATRVAAHCSSVFRFAIAKGIVKYNPIQDLCGALKPCMKRHYAAIGTDELPELLAALARVEGGMFLPTRIMMRLMLLVFVRTSELIETSGRRSVNRQLAHGLNDEYGEAYDRGNSRKRAG
jgi:integrase